MAHNICEEPHLGYFVIIHSCSQPVIFAHPDIHPGPVDGEVCKFPISL